MKQNNSMQKGKNYNNIESQHKQNTYLNKICFAIKKIADSKP